MVEYYKAPKLEKPDWLKQYLNEATVWILGTEIRIGDIVEKAIDWVIEVLTTFHDGIVDNFIALDERIYRVEQTALDNASWIRGVVTRLNNLEDNWDELLNDWFEAKKELVAGWFLEWHMPSKNLLLLLSERVQWLSGEAIEEEPPWWRPDQVLAAITEGIGKIINPWGESEEDTKNLFQWLWLFFKDPPKFLYEMAEEVIVRFW